MISQPLEECACLQNVHEIENEIHFETNVGLKSKNFNYKKKKTAFFFLLLLLFWLIHKAMYTHLHLKSPSN